MAEEATQAPEATQEETETVNADRFREVAKHKKAAEERAKALEKAVADLQAQIEDRESQNLPELDKLQKRLEAAEKRAQDAEQVAAEREAALTNTRKEGWLTSVARDLGFHDPEDALNPRHVKLEDIESRDDAERVLKKVARQKSHLIKPADTDRPQIGRRLENGKETDASRRDPAGVDLNDPDFKRQMGEDMLAVLRGERR